ncbi:hypothetical protein EVAR_66986_1 [Eumeta japonica]|uniref:Reverse transcriptase domain-containing protein n=1 Tax=Eumeta variegata TaxID=151549 RepID=A0A4C1ZWE7_EUMVA|nr:hypothetical protein EVAR_66986_1 [Eumeta japonica]
MRTHGICVLIATQNSGWILVVIIAYNFSILRLPTLSSVSTNPPANRNGLLELRARAATHNKTRRRPVVATRRKLKYYRSDRAAADTASDERPRPPTAILLGTALVDTIDNYGNIHTLRVLVDSASQKDLITAACWEAPTIVKPAISEIHTFCTYDYDSLSNCLNRFFELEDVPDASPLTFDESECETIYCETTRRDESGRYSVALPFKGDVSALGDSTRAAQRRYYSLERKLLVNPSIKGEYDNVFYEYLNKGYLVPVAKESKNDSNSQYVIPHHAVYRSDKSTKLRVVLDAIHENHRRFQRILYRFNINEPLQLYEMTRVPFGLRCSPYLAIRTVRQLAADEHARYPDAAAVAERDLYMDDLVSSCLTEQDAALLSDELIELFRTGGFDLIKFSSNSAQVMSSIPHTHRVSDNVEFDANDKLKYWGCIGCQQRCIYVLCRLANSRVH